MANAKPEQEIDENPLIASALRTLDTEAGGIAALIAAIRGALGAPLATAVDLIAKSTAGSSSPAWASPAMSDARLPRPSRRPARPPISYIRAKRATATSA